MNNSYYLPLQLDFPIFNTSLSPIDFLKSHPDWINFDATSPWPILHYILDRKNDLSTELHQFFANHNLEVNICEIFFRRKNNDGIEGIHSDGGTAGDLAKLNWIFDGDDSEMLWYTINDTYTNAYAFETVINTTALWYKSTEVDLVYSANVTGTVLVQAGCPHTVQTKNYERFCASVSFIDSKSKKFITMSEATELFKKFAK
jgi:hypothetical protein